MLIDQLVIVACGVASVYLSQDTRPALRRWACIAGMLAQPFWLFATWQAQQWGIFALAFVYTWGWGRGVWNFWFRGERA